MKNPISLVILATLLFVFNSIQTSAASNDLPPEIQKKIQRIENGLLFPVVIRGESTERMSLIERMKFYKTPAVSIAFINDGRIEWARAYGVREAGKSDSITSETRFQAGSISKSVTAIATLRLVQAGKLNLDEDVNKKLISWKVPENEFTKEKKVTLRMLLSHTAGANVRSFTGYLSDEPVPTLLQVLDGVKPANTPPIRVESLPGEGFAYSGGGYTIVQQLLIDVEKKQFPDLMRALVFDPLKMKSSTFNQDFPKNFASLTAAGHDANGETKSGKWRIFPEMAAAGMWTTPSDLAQIVIELQNALAGKSESFLSSEMVRQMLNPLSDNYGLGFFIEGTGKNRQFNHGGSTLEFNAHLLGYGERGQGVVIMTNSLKGERLINELLRSVANEYGWPDFKPKEKVIAKIDPKIYDSYLGTYQFEFSPDIVLTIINESGKLMMELKQPTGTSKTELYPESDVKFFRKDAEVEITFVKNETGRITHLIFTQDEQEFRVNKTNQK
jgi:CubicO group peptidase (beta-lactamase class C family)